MCIHCFCLVFCCVVSHLLIIVDYQKCVLSTTKKLRYCRKNVWKKCLYILHVKKVMGRHQKFICPAPKLCIKNLEKMYYMVNKISPVQKRRLIWDFTITSCRKLLRFVQLLSKIVSKILFKNIVCSKIFIFTK